MCQVLRLFQRIYRISGRRRHPPPTEERCNATSLKRSAAMLLARDFPGQLLRRNQLALIWWASRLKVADYGYALKAACTYYEYWHAAEGRSELCGAELSSSACARALVISAACGCRKVLATDFQP